MAHAMKTYSVTYRRDPGDDAWLVEVDGLPHVWTSGERSKRQRSTLKLRHRPRKKRREKTTTSKGNLDAVS